MQDIHNIIESLLFVAEEPLTIDKLKSILETVEAKEIKAALQALCDQYDSRGGGFGLHEVAGGWQLRSRPQYNEWIKRMLQPSPQRLSKPALETLAIVAYNQPIIRTDIEHIRGVDCGGVLRQLMERKLVRVLGRKEIPGRPLIYATTKLFLELFGLKDLKDLPSPKEIEEMAAAMEEANQVSTPDQSAAQASDGFQDLDNFTGTGAQPSESSSPNRDTGPPHTEAAPSLSLKAIARRFHSSALVLTPRPHISSRTVRISFKFPTIPGPKSEIY